MQGRAKEVLYTGRGLPTIHTQDGGPRGITLKNGKTIPPNTTATVTLPGETQGCEVEA